MPKSKQDFWLPKLNKNVERDQRTYHTLKLMGWDYLVIWECQLTNMDSIGRIIKDFLG